MENTKPYLKCPNKRQAKLCGQINLYLDYCSITRQMSKCTIYGKIATYKSFVATTSCRSLEGLTNEVFDAFIKTEVERGLNPSSINQKSANLIAMVRYWREMGLEIPLKIPMVVKLKERPTSRVFYTREQIRAVLQKCRSETQWLLIKIAFDTGMRITELTNLSLAQIHGRRVNFVGKGSKPREVYLCTDTSARLTAYINQNHIQDRLWLNRWGHPLATSSIRQIMREVFVRCGYPDFHPHALRHSFGSDIQRRGADVMVIKEMMGHSSVATTQRYLHGFEGQLEALFKKYKG